MHALGNQQHRMGPSSNSVTWGGERERFLLLDLSRLRQSVKFDTPWSHHAILLTFLPPGFQELSGAPQQPKSMFLCASTMSNTRHPRSSTLGGPRGNLPINHRPWYLSAADR